MTNFDKLNVGTMQLLVQQYQDVDFDKCLMVEFDKSHFSDFHLVSLRWEDMQHNFRSAVLYLIEPYHLAVSLDFYGNDIINYAVTQDDIDNMYNVFYAK